MPLVSTFGSLSARSFGLGAYRSAAFTPLSLFTGGVQGVWYDPSDLTTMFEDSAGTTPVHTPGNGTADSPVGKILDKSGNANHATQSTSTARPTLSARYNLLTYTEQFNNAVWQNVGASNVADQTTAPDGTTTADFLKEGSGGDRHITFQQITLPSLSNYTFSACIKASTRGYAAVVMQAGGLYCAIFDLSTGALTATNTTGSPTGTGYSATSLGNGWWRFSVTLTATNTTAYPQIALSNTGTPSTFAFGVPSYSGDGTSGVYIWGADLRVTNDGVGLPAYQRVVDANTYDSTGFPYYLNFDGVDDAIFTPSTFALGDFSSWVVFRPNSTTQTDDARVFEYGGNTGFDVIAKTGNVKFVYNWNSTSTYLDFSPVASIAVKRFMVSYQADSSSPHNLIASARTDTLNGTYAATRASSQMSSPSNLYISRFGGAGTPYNWNMRMYQLCVAGSYVASGTNSQMQSYLNGRFYVY